MLLIVFFDPLYGICNVDILFAAQGFFKITRTFAQSTAEIWQFGLSKQQQKNQCQQK